MYIHTYKVSQAGQTTEYEYMYMCISAARSSKAHRSKFRYSAKYDDTQSNARGRGVHGCPPSCQTSYVNS